MVVKKNTPEIEENEFTEVEKEFIITPASQLKYFKNYSIKGNKYGSRKADVDVDLEICDRMVKWWKNKFVENTDEKAVAFIESNNDAKDKVNDQGDKILQEMLEKPEENLNMNLPEFTEGMKANGFKEFQKKIINKR